MGAGLCALSLLALALTGCREVSVHVKLEEDGGAVVTETLAFAPETMELDGALKEGHGLLDLLGPEAARKRAELMGPGAKLKSHQVRRRPDGAAEMVAVYTIPDINELRVVSPFLGHGANPWSLLRCEVAPIFQGGKAAADFPAGMAVRFRMEPAGTPEKPAGGEPAAAPNPRELQILRDLQPMFRDWLRDARIRVSFEGYATLHGEDWPAEPVRERGGTMAARIVDLLDCSGDNLDNLGRSVFENEELMLEFLRGDFNGPNMREHLANWNRWTGYSFWNNPRLPLAFPKAGPLRYSLPPSGYYYKRYFDGRPKSQGGNAG